MYFCWLPAIGGDVPGSILTTVLWSGTLFTESFELRDIAFELRDPASANWCFSSKCAFKSFSVAKGKKQKVQVINFCCDLAITFRESVSFFLARRSISRGQLAIWDCVGLWNLEGVWKCDGLWYFIGVRNWFEWGLEFSSSLKVFWNLEGVVSFDPKMLLRTSLEFCGCVSIKVHRGGETKLLLPYAFVNGHQDCECICLCLPSCCSEEIDARQMSQMKSSGSGLCASTSVLLVGHHQGFATKKEKKEMFLNYSA